MPVLPAILEPSKFVADTGGKMWSRGSTLKLLDGSLDAMWTSFNGADAETRLTLVCDVLRNCDKWLRSKDERAAQVGSRNPLKKVKSKLEAMQADNRRPVIVQVGNAALKVLYDEHPEFKARITYEQKKLDALRLRKTPATKPLDKGFANERALYADGKKKRTDTSAAPSNPPAAGLVNKRLEEAKELEKTFGDTVYKDLNSSHLSVIKSATAKQFTDLASYEFDAIAQYAEKIGMRPVLKVGYLRRAERVQYMVFPGGKRLWRYDAQQDKDVPFDTGGQERIVTIDRYNNIYSSHDGNVFPDGTVLHHSSFVAGNEVVFAGNWVVSYGMLTKLTNESGHYKPARDEAHQALRVLFMADVNLDNCDLDILYRDGKTPMVEQFGNNSGTRKAKKAVLEFVKDKKVVGHTEGRVGGRM